MKFTEKCSVIVRERNKQCTRIYCLHSNNKHVKKAIGLQNTCIIFIIRGLIQLVKLTYGKKNEIKNAIACLKYNYIGSIIYT